ncbi:MAG: hypothetical protein A2901_04660 [Elusimicrobia bacterium RIFCSPLOWO2_01_FULL_54_10]|nr:MAG: hypothetical protein A2901_04660 [Elusimicrobia bacterium RIFCSPLOWO2_01_FULL_54_10]
MKMRVMLAGLMASFLAQGAGWGEVVVGRAVFSGGTLVLQDSLIDDFRDTENINSMGGNIGDFSNEGASHFISYSSTDFHNAANSLISRFSVPLSTSFAGIYFIFGTGAVAAPHDFSRFRRLSLWVRSDAGAPARVKVELVDNSGIHSAYIPDYASPPAPPINNTWQNYTLDFSTFTAGLNAAALQQFNIVYENSQIGRNAQGTVYYDDVEFVQ